MGDGVPRLRGRPLVRIALGMLRCLLLTLCAACAARGPGPAREVRGLRGDFDGDGRADRATLEPACAAPGCPRGVTVRLATGATEHLGPDPGRWERAEDGVVSPEGYSGDFSWIEAWKVVPRASVDGEAALPAGVRLPGGPEALPGLAGDAIWVTSSDAAILVYRGPAGWRFVELGY